MSLFARPLLTRPLLVTKNVRDASMAARAAGLELFRSGGSGRLTLLLMSRCYTVVPCEARVLATTTS